VAFLQELRDVHALCSGPWIVAGDFNFIYQAEDKNNTNLDRAMMGRFRRFLDEVEVKEIPLLRRKYTWSNERSSPTLVRLDRTLCCVNWEDVFPYAVLQSTVLVVSDHCPLVLGMKVALRPRASGVFILKVFGRSFPVFLRWFSRTGMPL